MRLGSVATNTYTVSIFKHYVVPVPVWNSVTVTPNPSGYTTTINSIYNDGSSNFSFQASITNGPSRGTFYWTLSQISGTIDSSTFTNGATSGTITLNSAGTAFVSAFVLTPSTNPGNATNNEFQLQIRSSSITGPVVATSASCMITNLANWNAAVAAASSINYISASSTTVSYSIGAGGAAASTASALTSSAVGNPSNFNWNGAGGTYASTSAPNGGTGTIVAGGGGNVGYVVNYSGGTGGAISGNYGSGSNAGSNGQAGTQLPNVSQTGTFGPANGGGGGAAGSGCDTSYESSGGVGATFIGVINAYGKSSPYQYNYSGVAIASAATGGGVSGHYGGGGGGGYQWEKLGPLNTNGYPTNVSTVYSITGGDGGAGLFIYSYTDSSGVVHSGIITTVGSGTLTIPAKAQQLTVSVIGGGGGGASNSYNGEGSYYNAPAGGPGGGGGGYATVTWTPNTSPPAKPPLASIV